MSVSTAAALRRVGARRQSLAPRSYGTELPSIIAFGSMSKEEQDALYATLTPEERDIMRRRAMFGLVGAMGLVVGLVTVPVFVVNPWIIKAFKPEWSYGRRLGASFAVSFIAGTLVSIARGLGGGSSGGEKEG